MSELTAEQFAQRAFDVGLLDERQLESVWAEFRSRDVPVEDFRRMLLRRELLTNYQAERLARGDRSGYFYGDYKVLYLVGTGSFARVFRAVHKETGKVAAIKALRKRYCDDRVATEQFLREGEMGKSLRHPNIVGIYEVHSGRAAHFLVMEFVEGHSLRDFVQIRRRLDAAEATRVMIDVASGLDFAFSKGITHRDLKLSNVLMSARGRAKLVDFGLASMVETSGDDLVDCPNPRTVDYAALEKITGVRKDDPRSDIYFSGCIFYHMLTGQPALHETKDRLQRMSVARFQDVAPVTQLVPDLPQPVALAVNKAMELRPENRYQTQGEMLRDLKLIARRLEKEFGAGTANGSPAEGADSAAAPNGAGSTVMIVETNVSLQDVLRERLKQDGFRVLVISDPQRAVARFMEEDQPADCVIFGGSQLGLAAIEAFNRLGELARAQHVPSILLLDPKQQALKARARLGKRRVVVSMPIRLKDFRDILHELIALSSGGAAPGD